MAVSQWTQADSDRARELWSEYERNHDVSDRIGQTAGIDPASGRIWFGDSITDVIAQRDSEGYDHLLYLIRVGFPTYYRKRGRRLSRA